MHPNTFSIIVLCYLLVEIALAFFCHLFDMKKAPC